MKYTSQHGIVGVIKPTMRPGSLEEFIRLMPEGVGVIPMFIGFNQGTKEEFAEGLSGYHPKVAELKTTGKETNWKNKNTRPVIGVNSTNNKNI